MVERWGDLIAVAATVAAPLIVTPVSALGVLPVLVLVLIPLAVLRIVVLTLLRPRVRVRRLVGRGSVIAVTSV